VYIVTYFEGVIQDSETINVMVNNAGIMDEKHSTIFEFPMINWTLLHIRC
jgi:short-subunit dehydrogenase involved in D-alanine esterification of teichoic acids